MAQKLNNLQVYQAKTWAGLTPDNYLGAIFGEQPYLASSIVARLHASQGRYGLDSLLNLTGSAEAFPDDRDFTWSLQGDTDKAINVVSYESGGSSSAAQPGLNQSIFKIIFGEKYFSKTDLLSADDRKFRVRVMTEPYSDGINWVYEVQGMNGDPTWFMPPSLLTSGNAFSKQYSPQEKTLSKTSGMTSYGSPFQMRNSFSTMRKMDIIPANMLNRPLTIGLPNPKGEGSINVWTQYAELEFMRQWDEEKNRQLIYGESNKNANGTYTMRGDSGFEIKEGSGLRDQISPSYKFPYTKFKIEWLEDILIQLSVNILPEDQRYFVALTGEWGMIQFSKSMEDYIARFNVRDEKRIFGSSQELGFGGQYVEYKGSNGVRFGMLKCAEYDNLIHNRILHPDGGPTESRRYTILHMGTTNGKKNIRKVYPKNEPEKMWHIAGSTSPFGPNTSFKTAAASPVDGYEVYAMVKQGLIVENPLACAELIYAGV